MALASLADSDGDEVAAARKDVTQKLHELAAPWLVGLATNVGP
jgi:hypothetical protein